MSTKTKAAHTPGWNNAYEWLMEYASKLNASQLFQEFSVLAGKLSDAAIRESYSYEMARDGFFPVLTPVNPCSDYAPDTLNPVSEERDVCTNCYHRGADHWLERFKQIKYPEACPECGQALVSNEHRCPDDMPEGNDWSGGFADNH